MDVKEIGKQLRLKNLPEIYSLGKIENNKYCLIHDGQFWYFFLYQDGRKKFLKFFESEKKATSFFKYFLEDNLNADKNITFFKSGTSDESIVINGLNIWEFSWVSNNKSFLVKDPKYNDTYLFDSYRIDLPSRDSVNFIAGEFSNNVWGIYLIKLEK